MKTFSPTPKDINREWFVVDAQDQVLGRLGQPDSPPPARQT